MLKRFSFTYVGICKLLELKNRRNAVETCCYKVRFGVD